MVRNNIYSQIVKRYIMFFKPLELLLFALLALGVSCNMLKQCRDPSVGKARKLTEKKFVMITGSGAGMGNFLIFFPSAYYFAVLTGREIIIQDDSIIGEMCRVLHCGYPLFSEMAAVFPSVLNQDVLKSAEGAKVGDFHQYLDGTKGDVKVVQAHGYKEQSGWYAGLEHALECISALTGCDLEDFSCHDRHALQQLIRGPFRSAFSAEEEKKIIGVPPNFKHGILTLPHVFAPRVDAAVHLRCQFNHFEWLVGRDDAAWTSYVQEVDDWLNSMDFNKGQALFKEIEAKIMAELGTILAQRKNKEARRRLLTTQYIDTYVEAHRQLSEKLWARPLSQRRALEEASAPPADANFTQLRKDLEHEHEVYHGAEDSSDRVYVYLAADNERVKEALAQYLLGHTNISVMRVHTGDIIVHVKNTGYLKQTRDGVMALAVDWYSLSLANVLFAWRRDTDITSTFARSAMKLSGSPEVMAQKVFDAKPGAASTDSGVDRGAVDAAGVTPTAVEESFQAKMFQLVYRNGRAIWK